MSLDFNNIKRRFLLQVIFFILFCLLAGGILGFGLGRTGSMNEIKNILTLVHNNLIESNSSGMDFQLNTDTDEDLITSGKNRYTNQFGNSIKIIRDTLSYLQNSTILSHSNDFLSAKDTFIMSLNSYETSFNYLVLAYKEIGQKNAGNINSIQSISDKIPSLAVASKIEGFAELAASIKKYEGELLFNFDLRAYDQLSQVLDDIRNKAMMQNLNPEENDALLEVLDTYNQKLLSIYNQIKLLDPNGTQGLTAELQTDYFKVLQQFELLKSGFIAGSHMMRIVWMTITFLILLLAIGAYVLLLLKLRNEINEPVHHFIDFSYNLSKGKLQTSESALNVKYEFKTLGNNLLRINNSLLEKKKFIDSLLKQKFDVDVVLQGKNDTFGKTLIALKENLRKTREEQLQHAEQNQLRRYLNEGIAKFSDILRTNSDDLTKLSDAFIKELVRYLEAIQGGLFLLHENNESMLYLASAFAFNRKRYLTKDIQVGEGLVGTCAIERKTINLTEIPEDYVEITSGLGDTPPTNLLLLPVMSENILIGVIELASLKTFKQHQIEVGERISESLATTIISARVNTRTAQLLKKSQEQAAEMAEQEEEMRQNMEELKATQEESARREEELEAILSSLNNSYYVLEYDTEGLIISANRKILSLLKKSSDDVIGMHHTGIFGIESKGDSELFARVSDGETVELVENILVNKKEVKVKNTFSPVKTKDRKVIKILNIMTMINND